MEACSKHRLNSSYLLFFTSSNSCLHILASFLLVSKAMEKNPKLQELLIKKSLSKQNKYILSTMSSIKENTYCRKRNIPIYCELPSRFQMEDPQTSKVVMYPICSVLHLSGARNKILLIPSGSQAALSSTSTDLVQLQNPLGFLHC